MPKVFILDPGHGGVIKGKYVTAPNKMWKFPDGTTIYEGVINRIVVKFIEDMAEGAGIHTIDITGGSQLDVPLSVRTDNANNIYKEYPDAVYCSIHCNAGKGVGTEIYTSIGITESDRHATVVIDKMRQIVDDFIIRPDWSDGDVDKESKFWVLIETNMPAWLLEIGFMDSMEDAKKLLDYGYLQTVAKAIVEYMKEA